MAYGKHHGRAVRRKGKKKIKNSTRRYHHEINFPLSIILYTYYFWLLRDSFDLK